MKAERRSFLRSARGFQRRSLGNGTRPLVESRCLACGEILVNTMDQSFQRSGPAVIYPSAGTRISGKVAKKRPSIDVEKLLHFSRQLYAHALTLQDVIRNGGEVAYEVLRPRYDRQAAQQFEIFYPALKRPSALRKRSAESCE